MDLLVDNSRLHLRPWFLGNDQKNEIKQLKCFHYRMAGLSLREMMMSLDSGRYLTVEPLLFHIKTNKLRWIGHLIRMTPFGGLSSMSLNMDSLKNRIWSLKMLQYKVSFWYLVVNECTRDKNLNYWLAIKDLILPAGCQALNLIFFVSALRCWHMFLCNLQ